MTCMYVRRRRRRGGLVRRCVRAVSRVSSDVKRYSLLHAASCHHPPPGPSVGAWQSRGGPESHGVHTGTYSTRVCPRPQFARGVSAAASVTFSIADSSPACSSSPAPPCRRGPRAMVAMEATRAVSGRLSSKAPRGLPLSPSLVFDLEVRLMTRPSRRRGSAAPRCQPTPAA